ncbi:MAG: hypothetical protein HDP34_05880 [Clostridia bacterium]|nr:hypothetical protein [Clostridia bacterium]
MNIFKFRFTKLTLAFIYIGLILAAVAFGVNTYFVFAEGIKTAANPVYPILQYSLMYFVCVLLFVILLSLLLSSYYAVEGDKLKTSFGIIKSKYDIKKIETIVLDRTTNKLSVYFDGNTFIVIAVKPEWYEEFTDAILKVNPKIEFSIKSKENKKDDEEQK